MSIEKDIDQVLPAKDISRGLSDGERTYLDRQLAAVRRGLSLSKQKAAEEAVKKIRQQTAQAEAKRKAVEAENRRSARIAADQQRWTELSTLIPQQMPGSDEQVRLQYERYLLELKRSSPDERVLIWANITNLYQGLSPEQGNRLQKAVARGSNGTETPILLAIRRSVMPDDEFLKYRPVPAKK